jgi:hypothetical protein
MAPLSADAWSWADRGDTVEVVVQLPAGGGGGAVTATGHVSPRRFTLSISTAESGAAEVGLGLIVALRYRSSTIYQIH